MRGARQKSRSAPQLSADPWYEQGEDTGLAVGRLLDGFKSEQAGRRARYIRNVELYEGRRMSGYSAHSYIGDATEADVSNEFPRDRLRLVRSAVSTAVSTIYAPQKPKPQFQTLGATWATRRKAYRLDRICEGVLNQRQGRWVNVWAFMADAGAECSLQGNAAVKVTADREQKRIAFDLTALPDLFVDPAEGRNPKNLFQRAPIDEAEALKRFPKAKAAIAGAKPYEWFGRSSTSRPRASKVIEIQYAWRLPFSKDKPGHWCAVINGEVVDSGKWTAPSFPFVFLQWEPHRDGFWASGIADEGAQIAEECSELDKRLLLRSVVASNQVVTYEKESCNPDDLALNDERVVVAVEKGSMPPNFSTIPGLTESDLENLETRKRDFWDAIGISQVSAAARREQGVSSGIALMTLNDTKAGRQLVKAQRYEQAYVDIAHQIVWRLRELAEDEPDFKVTWPGKSILRTIDFATADVDDDEFTVNVAPSSALPHDPAGRQQMVESLLQSSLISQETAKELIGWPDLASELNIENAESEYIDSLIERYLDAEQGDWDTGDYEAPEGFIFNKIGALRRFASAWFRARIDQQSLPRVEKAKAEFNIGLLSRYIQELNALIAPPAPPPGAQVGPGPAPAGPLAPDQLATPKAQAA